MTQRAKRAWTLVGAGAVVLCLLLLNKARVVSFSRYRGEALRLWTDPLFTLGNLPISPLFVIKASVFLVCLFSAASLGRRLVASRLLARTAIDPGLQYAIKVGTGYFIVTFGLIIGLQSVGLNLSSLAFLTGIIGVGVGFGTQNIMNNFVSGLILLVERPVKVGDRVEIGDLNGDVIRIAARSTWVKTNDNVIIIVPNSEFVSNRVTNWTANDRSIRIRLPVGVGYSSDVVKVRSVLLEVAQARSEVLDDPEPDVIFSGFGDSSLDFELRVWTTERLRTPQILKSDLYFDIFQKFADNEIEIPFPQRDLHIRSFSPTLSISHPDNRQGTVTGNNSRGS